VDPYQKKFISLAHDNARRHRLFEVFRDFCEMSAISLSNRVDRPQLASREERYLTIAGRYSPDEMERFAEMLALVTESLEAQYHDCLGELFMSLELGNHWRGQFFTPYALSSLCARAMIETVPELLERKPFVTVNEPTSGGGGMVIALAEAMLDAGYNYQQQLHVVAQDVDATSVHMTYIQLSLLYVPAIVMHGNTLSGDQPWERWFTPAHVLDGWGRRLSKAEREEQCLTESETTDHNRPSLNADSSGIAGDGKESGRQLALL
jgi:hypothetical protein